MIGRKKLPPVEATVVPRPEHCISRADISQHALKVLKKLHKAGYQSYLVGGGVRDLLLRKAPKDFDVATSATPDQVKKTFRNCRLIGKRFPLAHIHFGREIIEVATFRALESGKPKDNKSSMIWRDNHFGTLEEDAFRRDFTVNALYYNIADFSVVDFTQGIADLNARKLKMIGDPAKRYAEDPVRMLRAIRFATKLEFSIDDETASPIRKMAKHLEEVSPSRLFEEFLKLFHYGHAKDNFIMLAEYGLLQILFPEVSRQFEDEKIAEYIINCLESTDARVRQGKPVTPAFLLAAFLWPVANEYTQAFKKAGMSYLVASDKGMKDAIGNQLNVVAISKRVSSMIREIWQLQNRLERRAGSKCMALLHHPRFRAAYDFLIIRAMTGDVEESIATWWTEFQDADEDTREVMLAPLNKPRRQTYKNKKNVST